MLMRPEANVSGRIFLTIASVVAGFEFLREVFT